MGEREGIGGGETEIERGKDLPIWHCIALKGWLSKSRLGLWAGFYM